MPRPLPGQLTFGDMYDLQLGTLDRTIFTKVWSQEFEIIAKPEWEKDGLFEYVCQENNRCPGGKCAEK